MAAAENQDFVTFQGDYVVPVFTVYSDLAAGTVLDISTVTEISWYARVDLSEAVVLTKLKSLGQITFVTTGVDGKFQVILTAADTAALDGAYLHYATITDVSGHITTVAVGAMRVGLTPEWTYNPALLSTKPHMQIRRLIGDVIRNDQQMMDAEILFSYDTWADIYLAAADCCRNLAAQYARKIDVTAPGEIRTAYSQQTKNYTDKAKDLERLGSGRGAGIIVFAGGISIESKELYEADTDRVQPQFNIGLMDNLDAPVPPVGNETPNPGPNSQASGLI